MMTDKGFHRFLPSRLLDNLRRDLRYSMRQIVRRPAFALFVVLTLAVGIGPNVAIFSVLKALVLQPFYYPEPDRLVQVWQTDIAGRWHQPFTSPDYFDIREQSTVFEEFGVYTTRVFNLSEGEPVRVQGVAGTASVLKAYGVMPAMGRLFTEEEEQEGRDNVVILSSGLWSSRFGADLDIIGRKIRVNSEEHEVIGVMPEEFQFSSPWFRGSQFEIWKPIILSREESARGSHWLLGIARLKDGVDWRSAESEIRAIAAQLAEAYTKTNARTQVWIMPFAFEILGRFIGQLLILSGEIWLSGPRYESDRAKAAFWEQLIERIKGLPGVDEAAVASKLPLEGGTNGNILVDGEVYDPQVMRPLVEQSYASADYFEAIGIPFLAGRTLNKADETSSEKGVVVNRALVDRYWPDESALGRRIRSNSDPPSWEVFVVGVVDNVRQWSSIHRPLPEMYVPYGARPRTKAKLIVRTRVEPRSLVPIIRQEVSRLDPDIPLADIRTMEDVFSVSTRGRRFLTLLLDLFTVIALVLSITGIYGFVSYHVAQRTHEIGIRVALGATRRNLLWMVLKSALVLVIIGIAIGLAMTVNASFIAGSLVYGISPLNPLYISGGVLFVILVAMMASSIPALRGSRIDPVQALRIE